MLWALYCHVGGSRYQLDLSLALPPASAIAEERRRAMLTVVANRVHRMLEL